MLALGANSKRKCHKASKNRQMKYGFISNESFVNSFLKNHLIWYYFSRMLWKTIAKYIAFFEEVVCSKFMQEFPGNQYDAQRMNSFKTIICVMSQ